jgi:ABC-type sugar transport system ATPase subunit
MRRVTALLEIKGLTKAYPGVVANDDVSFSIAPARSTRFWAKTARASRRWSR